jgi:hypothetical protein
MVGGTYTHNARPVTGATIVAARPPKLSLPMPTSTAQHSQHHAQFHPQQQQQQQQQYQQHCHYQQQQGYQYSRTHPQRNEMGLAVSPASLSGASSPRVNSVPATPRTTSQYASAMPAAFSSAAAAAATAAGGPPTSGVRLPVSSSSSSTFYNHRTPQGICSADSSPATSTHNVAMPMPRASLPSLFPFSAALMEEHLSAPAPLSSTLETLHIDDFFSSISAPASANLGADGFLGGEGGDGCAPTAWYVPGSAFNFNDLVGDGGNASAATAAGGRKRAATDSALLSTPSFRYAGEQAQHLRRSLGKGPRNQRRPSKAPARRRSYSGPVRGTYAGAGARMSVAAGIGNPTPPKRRKNIAGTTEGGCACCIAVE